MHAVSTVISGNKHTVCCKSCLGSSAKDENCAGVGSVPVALLGTLRCSLQFTEERNIHVEILHRTRNLSGAENREK